ncbi:MAG: ROK family protein [Saprospiraceae bacterium]|nr:ROK family protein [Saprospiraceae bacterium]
MNDKYILAMDLGGTKLASALFNAKGEILYSDFMKLEGRTGHQVGLMVIECIENYFSRSQDSGQSIDSIGIAVPGIYNGTDGKVWAPNIPGWNEYPLRDELQLYLQGRGVSLRLDSDRACYILGEYWKGAATGCQHAIYLAVGTGIGAGIMIDGKVLRGSHDIAGAIGWMALRAEYHPLYEKYGCFEYHASGQGIAIHAQDFYGDTRAVFKAYEEGDERVLHFIEDAILSWGQASANLVSLFNPEIIVFGGGVFGPAQKYIDQIYKEACRWAQPISIRQTRFVPTQLGDQVALYGAAYLAMDL